MNELISTLLTRATSHRERDVLRVMASKGVNTNALVCKHIGASSGYVAVLLRRLCKKGMLEKKGEYFYFKNHNLLYFIKCQEAPGNETHAADRS